MLLSAPEIHHWTWLSTAGAAVPFCSFAAPFRVFVLVQHARASFVRLAPANFWMHRMVISRFVLALRDFWRSQGDQSGTTTTAGTSSGREETVDAVRR